MAEPAFLDYLTFSFYFVLAKFSVAAIPAGGIIIMIPIIEDYLGFNSEMISLITAIYVLFDPVITGANILGNGGFAMLVNKIYSRSQRRKTSTVSLNSNIDYDSKF
jgi:Na+/H+-dicarboxylate symporter